TDRSRAERLANEIHAHCQKLAAAGLSPHSPILLRRGLSLVGRLFGEALVMNVGFLVVLAGTLHHVLPFLLTRGVAALTQAPGRSTTALARLGAGVPLYSAWYAIVGWWLADYFLPWVACVWLVPMPFAGVLALAYWGRVKRTSPHWWRQTGLLLRPARLQELRCDQDALTAKLSALTAEFATVQPPEPVPTSSMSWRRLAWASLRWSVGIFMGLWLASWGMSWSKREQIAELMAPAPALAGVSNADLGAMLDVDERTLQQVLVDLGHLQTRVAQLRSDFEAGRRDFYRQADN